MKGFDLRALDHTAVANEGDLAPSKTLGNLIDLKGKSLGILSISGEDFDGQRPPGIVTQQANDNLQLSAFAIAVIAKGAKGVVFALEISAGHIIKQEFFDIRLLLC